MSEAIDGRISFKCKGVVMFMLDDCVETFDLLFKFIFLGLVVCEDGHDFLVNLLHKDGNIFFTLFIESFVVCGICSGGLSFAG